MVNHITGWTDSFPITLLESLTEKGNQKGNFKFKAYVTRWDPNKEGWSIKSRNGVRYNKAATIKAFEEAIAKNNGLVVMYNHITEGGDATVLGRINKVSDDKEGLIVEGILDGNEPLVRDKIAKGLLSNVSLQVSADEEKSRKISEDNREVYYAFPDEAYEVSFVPVNGILGGNLLSTALMEKLQLSQPGELTTGGDQVKKQATIDIPEPQGEPVSALSIEEEDMLYELMKKQYLKNELNGAETFLISKLEAKAAPSDLRTIKSKLLAEMEQDIADKEFENTGEPITTKDSEEGDIMIIIRSMKERLNKLENVNTVKGFEPKIGASKTMPVTNEIIRDINLILTKTKDKKQALEEILKKYPLMSEYDLFAIVSDYSFIKKESLTFEEKLELTNLIIKEEYHNIFDKSDRRGFLENKCSEKELEVIYNGVVNLLREDLTLSNGSALFTTKLHGMADAASKQGIDKKKADEWGLLDTLDIDDLRDLNNS